jgi:predicted metalloprotease with PDZ domain
MCLDTEIRYQTGGKRSLDDVIRSLYEECKDNKPGFEEGEIRKLAVRFGGPALGPFYDKVVMTAGELPIEDQLAKVGYKIVEIDEPYVDHGFTYTSAKDKHGANVATATGPGEGKLKAGDVITSINGESLDVGSNRKITEALNRQFEAAKVGTPITLKVLRGTDTIDVQIDPVAATRKVKKVQEDPSASPEAVRLRSGWLQNKTAPMSYI